MTPDERDSSGTETATDPEASPAPRGDHPRRGDVLDRYVIVDHLGTGGMGSVYRAYDPELDRGVAIKLVRTDRGHQRDDRQRILREARAIAKLSHPNVVSVFDVGEHAGAVFIVMELVHGENLAEWAEAKERSADEVLDIYRAAGAGVCAAHAAGILHRDIKPRNILVGDDGRVLVADFGLARTVDGVAPAPPERELTDSPAHDETLTHAGALIGSPAYMPPERLAGQPGDERSDQFSFCVSLYETMTGHRPPRDDAGRVELASQQLERIPAHVRRALTTGLHHAPDDRFPDMQSLVDGLAPRPRRSKTLLAALTATAAVAVGLAYAVAGPPATSKTCNDLGAPMRTVWTPDAEASLRAAFAASGHASGARVADELIARVNRRIARWTASRTEACRATDRGQQSADLLDRRMACYDRQLTTIAAYRDAWLDAPSPNTVENAVPRFERSSDGSECSAELVVSAPAIPSTDEAKATTALIDQATTRKILGFEDHALELVDRAVDAAKPIGSDSLLAEAHYTRASVLSWLKRHEDAYAALQLAAEHAAAAGDDRRLAFIVSEMVFQLGDRLGRSQEALALGALGQTLVTRAGGDDALRVHFLSNYGVALQRAGKLEESEQYLREALDLRRKEGRDDPHELTNALNRLGNTMFNAGRVDDAEALFREATEILAADSSRSTRLSRAARSNWAMALAAQGKRARAIDIFLEVVEQERAAYGPDSAELMYPYHNLAWAYAGIGKYDLAVKWGNEGIALLERIGRSDHPIIAYKLLTIAEAQVGAEQLDEAWRTLDRLVAFIGDNQSLADLLALAHHYRAEIHRTRGNLAEAERLYQAALDTHATTQAPEADTVKPLFGLAQVYWTRGKREHALRLARRAKEVADTADADIPFIPEQIDAWLADHR